MTNFGINSTEGRERIVGVAISPGAAASSVLTADGAGGTSWAAGGGSQPAIGRPKADDGTTYYGVPFVDGWDQGWQALILPQGKISYTPWIVRDAITVTELEFTVEQAAADSNGDPIDTHVRLVIVAANTDWQPTGSPVLQQTAVLPGAASGGDDIDIDGLSVAITPGRYLVGVETDAAADWLTQPGIRCQPGPFEGSSVCVSTGGIMPINFTATHAYGALSDPLPRWTAPVPAASLGSGYNAPWYPFFFMWDPA